jgi:RNA polymerase sigma-70 factor (sigma-E family)
VEPSSDARDAGSFDTYVQLRGTTLTRFAYLLVRDHHLAQDLTQESLARLHRHWNRVNGLADRDAYVRKVMLNQFLSWRRRRSWSEHTAPDIDPATVEDPATASAERDAMWALLGELPPQQRAVLVLRFYEDLDDDAIAVLLNCSPATVRSHSSKALAKLRATSVAPDLACGGTRG